MRATIEVNGFIGDILFATSIAKPLRDKGYDDIQFIIRHWEPFELLALNPHITGVHVSNGHAIADPENRVFDVGEIDQSVPATIQFQQKCGIENPTLEYKVYTNKIFDSIAQNHVALIKASTQRKVVAYQANWRERSFGFTQEEYERGNDNIEGYGHRRRDITKILQILSPKYVLAAVGLPDGTPNGNMGIFSAPTYSMTASLIKNCDWMIGAEGGLTNLAAGVGTKTIITGDFVHQVYGWNGSVKKIREPKMGPKTYFPDAGHVTLDPYLSDEEVAEQMIGIIG